MRRLKQVFVEVAGTSEIAGLEQAFGSRQNLHEEKGADPREDGRQGEKTAWGAIANEQHVHKKARGLKP